MTNSGKWERLNTTIKLLSVVAAFLILESNLQKGEKRFGESIDTLIWQGSIN